MRTIVLEETESSFAYIADEVNRTGLPATVLKDNRPWVIVSPVVPSGITERGAVDTALDSMNEYADVFEKLAGKDV